jgi:predicted GH43/DUF377 family glycosyl hydrolase
MDGSVYRLGVALHDLQNPAKIVGVGDSWILQPGRPLGNNRICPQRSFHLWGRSWVRWNCEDLLGAVDTVMCVGEASISDLVALCQ